MALSFFTSSDLWDDWNFGSQMDRFLQPSRERDQTPKELSWRPRVDMRETEKNYHIHVELPGVKKEDVKLDFKDELLTLSGEKKHEKEEKEENYWKTERSYGSFSRTFRPPEDVKPQDIKAKFDNGVLALHIPK